MPTASQKAICKLSCFRTAKAAKSAVKVVPMLEPKVMGNILCTGKTPMPQSGVKAEVTTEELWTYKAPDLCVRYAFGIISGCAIIYGDLYIF